MDWSNSIRRMPSKWQSWLIRCAFPLTLFCPMLSPIRPELSARIEEASLIKIVAVRIFTQPAAGFPRPHTADLVLFIEGSLVACKSCISLWCINYNICIGDTVNATDKAYFLTLNYKDKVCSSRRTGTAETHPSTAIRKRRGKWCSANCWRRQREEWIWGYGRISWSLWNIAGHICYSDIFSSRNRFTNLLSLKIIDSLAENIFQWHNFSFLSLLL